MTPAPDGVPAPDDAAGAGTGRAVRWRTDRSVAVSPDGQEVWLFGPEGPVRLAGLGTGPLALAIDGVRERDGVLMAAVDAGVDAERAARFLDRWSASGHVTTEPVIEVRAPSVRVVGGDVVETTAVSDALVAAGVVIVEDGDDALLEVLVTGELLKGLETVAEEGLDRVIVVQLRGAGVLVAPVMAPGRACPECLVSRIRVRRAMDLLASQRAGLDSPPPSPRRHPAAPVLAGGVVASMAWAEAHAEDASGSWLVTVDPQTGEATRHLLVPVPACPRCDPDGPSVVGMHLREPDGSPGRELAAGGGLVRGTGTVGYRAVDPEETWERHSSLVSDVIGVVPVVERIGPPGLRTYVSGPNLVGLDDPAVARSALRSTGGGKGLTMSAARAGALAEAIERDALRARGDEPVQRATMAELDAPIHPNTIQLFSDRQIAESEAVRASGQQLAPGRHVAPTTFDPERARDWGTARSLVTGRLHQLPASMLYLRWPRPVAGDPPGCSNGAAAGNTIEEAQLQGLLEVVERDAVALWWYARSRRTAWDLASWDDPRIATALAPHLDLGMRVWVLDLTTDLGVPAAVAIGMGDRWPWPMLGAGAHLDPAIAVTRAITEMAQVSAPLLSVTDVSEEMVLSAAEKSWFHGIDLADEPWLTGVGTTSPVDAPQYGSVTEARDDLVSRLSSRGYEVLWSDLTRTDTRLPVVRTWVPGLRHFWPRFAPGRLYDVPLAQGWIAEAFDEASRNPRDLPL